MIRIDAKNQAGKRVCVSISDTLWIFIQAEFDGNEKMARSWVKSEIKSGKVINSDTMHQSAYFLISKPTITAAVLDELAPLRDMQIDIEDCLYV